MDIPKKRSRPRKSEALSEAEMLALKTSYNAFPTKYDATIHFGVPYQTIDRILQTGSGSPETVAKLRKKLK